MQNIYKMKTLFNWTWISIFVKGYEILSFDKNIGKNVSKNLSGKHSQKLFKHAQHSVTDALKTTLKRVIQNTVEATGDLIDNKVANKIVFHWDKAALDHIGIISDFADDNTTDIFAFKENINKLNR